MNTIFGELLAIGVALVLPSAVFLTYYIITSLNEFDRESKEGGCRERD